MTVLHGLLQTREQRRDAAWAEYEAGYNAAYAEAVDEKVCFCVCGCKRVIAEPPRSVSGTVKPSRCPECRSGLKDAHALIRPPVETFDWAKYEDPEPPKQPRRRHFGISAFDRYEAESYVRKHGRRGFKTLERMHQRLSAGRPLTDAQASAALRSKAADMRAEIRAAEDASESEGRLRKATDLNRVYIPDEVVDGKYLVADDEAGYVQVDIKRPQRGPFAGRVLVTLRFGDSVVTHGHQRPQPWREGFVNTYEGEFAHLVAKLVANPEQARTDYQQAVEAA